jgi:hypothetical protein
MLEKVFTNEAVGGTVRDPVRTGAGQPARGADRVLSGVLKPRPVLALAMAILSFSLAGKLAGPGLEALRAVDFQPVRIWSVLDERLHRAWDRAVMHCESTRLAIELRYRLEERAGGEGEQ